MRAFAHLPIQRKVSAFVLAVFFCATVLTAAALFIYQSLVYPHRAENFLNAQANLLAVSLDAPVAWGNLAEGEAILRRMRSATEIAQAFVLELPDRQRVILQSPADSRLPDFLRPVREGVYFREGQIWLVKDLQVAQGGPYATLVLHSRLESLRREQTRSLAILILVFLVLLLLSLGLAHFLSRSLSDPVSSLAQTIHQITQGGHRGLRATPVSTDEIGQLAREFNRMLDALEQREAELVASERNYREILDGTSDPIFLHDPETGSILDVNRAAEQQYGYSREELLRISIGEISDGAPTDTQAMAKRWIDRAVQEGSAIFEWLARRRNGESFWVEVSLRSTRIGSQGRVLAMIRDISRRKLAEESLRESEMRFRSLVEEAGSLPIQGYDQQRRIIFWNKASERLYGFTREEAIGRRLEETIIPPDLRDQAIQMAHDWIHLGRPIPPGEVELLHKNGSTVPVYSTHVLLHNRHGDPELYCLDFDLSERRRAAADREKLLHQLFQAQKMEAIGQLAGGVAHDFNNLLQGMFSFANLALDRLPSDSPARPDLREVLQAGERASGLVRQLLTFSRRQTNAPEFLSLNQVVVDFLKLVRRVIGEQVRVEFHPGLPEGVVQADRGQLEQVLMNLCVNARDALPRGGTITLSTEPASFDEEACRIHPWAKPGTYCCLSVSDNGSGMEAKTLEHIFEPFFTTKSPGKGSGLGLATVYGIVKQHQGLIQVYSEPGRGSVFRIYLPRSERAPGTVRPPRDLSVQGGPETILLAEDEDLVRKSTSYVLTRAGYSVLAVSNGREALEVFQNKREEINLALLDVVMPGLGGWEAAQELRKMRPELPILLASGYSPELLQLQSIEGPPLVLIQKPFAPRDLLARVRDALDGRTLA